MQMLLLLLVILLVFAMLPAWPYSRTWGYTPSGLLTAIVLILLLFWLL